MKIEQPLHEGELEVQGRVGVLHEGAENSQVIQDSIIKGALRFVSQQSMAVLGSIDGEQNIWASVLVGQTGFMRADDERTVTFDLGNMARNPDDPFWENITSHPQVGMLVIELASRRRLRVNGKITREAEESLRLQVDESYPNCPKYIQRRQVSANLVGTHQPSTASNRGETLGLKQRATITKADTLFVASAHAERGVDASHRGGNPGFVKVIDDRTLQIPDYEGNSIFNTLGNFTANPRAGLIFLDFESQRTLQLTGRPEILWDVDDPTSETGGTNRYWLFHIDRWVEIDHGHQLEWSFQDYSPYNPKVSNS